MHMMTRNQIVVQYGSESHRLMMTFSAGSWAADRTRSLTLRPAPAPTARRSDWRRFQAVEAARCRSKNDTSWLVFVYSRWQQNPRYFPT